MSIRRSFLGYSQREFIALGLDYTDIILLTWLTDFAFSGKMKTRDVEIDGESVRVFWVAYKKVLADLPGLSVRTADGIGRRFKKLVEKEVLVSYTLKTKKGTFVFYGVGPAHDSMKFYGGDDDDDLSEEAIPTPPATDSVPPYPPDKKSGAHPILPQNPPDSAQTHPTKSRVRTRRKVGSDRRLTEDRRLTVSYETGTAPPLAASPLDGGDSLGLLEEKAPITEADERLAHFVGRLPTGIFSLPKAPTAQGEESKVWKRTRGLFADIEAGRVSSAWRLRRGAFGDEGAAVAAFAHSLDGGRSAAEVDELVMSAALWYKAGIESGSFDRKRGPKSLADFLYSPKNPNGPGGELSWFLYCAMRAESEKLRSVSGEPVEAGGWRSLPKKIRSRIGETTLTRYDWSERETRDYRAATAAIWYWWKASRADIRRFHELRGSEAFNEIRFGGFATLTDWLDDFLRSRINYAPSQIAPGGKLWAAFVDWVFEEFRIYLEPDEQDWKDAEKRARRREREEKRRAERPVKEPLPPEAMEMANSLFWFCDMGQSDAWEEARRRYEAGEREIPLEELDRRRAEIDRLSRERERGVQAS
jgi:hypothetical protein